MNINGNICSKIVPVAVAVLQFGNKFLLATRQNHQHQGGKLEFVGGKIEQGETPPSALIREVNEELGLDISQNFIEVLGDITHRYEDLTVQLFVFKIVLTQMQFDDFSKRGMGLDGQAIGFYDKAWLLANAECFPKANMQILAWLADE